MKFKKEVLQELAWEDYDEAYEVVEHELVDTTRWSLLYSMVFSFKDKLYRTSYSTGATESQDECPYEYDSGEIECVEVEPVEVTVTEYRNKK